jgi:hypothetical protein
VTTDDPLQRFHQQKSDPKVALWWWLQNLLVLHELHDVSSDFPLLTAEQVPLIGSNARKPARHLATLLPRQQAVRVDALP